jgi:hypothetical protein
MTVSDHIDSLKAKHADLERKIEAEEQRPMPDTVAVHSLKKEKLKIKDEIARLSG